ncbi:hypothetical protein D9M68_659950 [compost metagenome]
MAQGADDEGARLVARHVEERAAGQQPHGAARGEVLDLGAARGVEREAAAVGQRLRLDASDGGRQGGAVAGHPLAPGLPERGTADAEAAHAEQGRQRAAPPGARRCHVAAPAVQRGLDAVERPHHLALHGLDRHAMAARQFGMAGAVEPVGQEDVAAARRQGPQRGIHRVECLPVGDAVGHVPCAVVVVSRRQPGVGVDGGGAEALGAALAAAQVVDGEVLGHGVDVGAHGGLGRGGVGGGVVPRLRTFGQPDPRVMRQLPRLVRAAGAARDEAHQFLVAVLEGFQQRAGGELGGHGLGCGARIAGELLSRIVLI